VQGAADLVGDDWHTTPAKRQAAIWVSDRDHAPRKVEHGMRTPGRWSQAALREFVVGEPKKKPAFDEVCWHLSLRFSALSRSAA